MQICDLTIKITKSTRRKHIVFRVIDQNTLEILAPARVSDGYLEKIASGHIDIINKLKSAAASRLSPEFNEGAEFFLLGKLYPLHLTQRLKVFNDKFMIPDGNDEQKKTHLISLYKSVAERYFRQHLSLFANKMQLFPQKIRISSASGRWGSCTASGTISLSWKLIQCPPEMIDYVIVHELSHLKELNHSANFWQVVQQTMPDYLSRRKALQDFAKKLPNW